ncbi:MAG: transglutaminase family protein [Opitutaceae bacterium]
MQHYRISHVTTFNYSYPVAVSHHSAHLKPRTNAEQKCHRFDLNIRPRTADTTQRIDFFGNTSQLFSIQELHDQLTVESTSIVTSSRVQVALNSLTLPCNDIRDSLIATNRNMLNDELQFVFPTDATPDHESVAAFGKRFFSGEKPIGTSLLEILSAFKTEFDFDATATDVHTPITESLKKKRGVCQDFAHLMIAAARACGLSAHYCSGYILTTPPEGQPRLIGADASHAWVAIHVPGIGWVQVDPTNNQSCDDQYVLVAIGRDYSDVTMLKGAVSGGGEHTVDVGVTMLPIDDVPIDQELAPVDR